ncbi:MAG: 4Fe-4S binding protein [Clostridia bacterium]|nr:4Fe-4S binding protein [Clostridia bacterium]
MKITDACIGCGSCAAQCPVGAIADQGGSYQIDQGACIGCGACAGQCPVGAIVD